MAGRPRKTNIETIETKKSNYENTISRIDKEILEIKELLGQATAEGRGMVGVYEAIEAIKNRLIDLDRLEEKINQFIIKVEKIHENKGCQL